MWSLGSPLGSFRGIPGIFMSLCSLLETAKSPWRSQIQHILMIWQIPYESSFPHLWVSWFFLLSVWGCLYYCRLSKGKLSHGSLPNCPGHKNRVGQTQSWEYHTFCSCIVNNWKIHFTSYAELQKATYRECFLEDSSNLSTRNVGRRMDIKKHPIPPSPLEHRNSGNSACLSPQGKPEAGWAQIPGFLFPP